MSPTRCFHRLALVLAALRGLASKVLIKGVSYGPVPLRSQNGAAQLPADDWFCDEAIPMWGKAGRGDLRVMRQLGANMVRLYGNNPDQDHTNFLDEAALEDLSVAPGMSDFPYYQDQDRNCMRDTDYNCFSQVKPLYLQNLQRGFLTLDKKYHSSLKYMNIINEPDLKMPPAATGSREALLQMCRAIISAFDAMLDAEREAGVTGPLINFTATFSYAICGSCEFSAVPALGQMAQLDDAMRNPGKYDYAPRNDITAAYEARFTHSFNTQNPATDMQHQFLNPYAIQFPATPVYIAEYHRPGANQTQDLDMILNLAMVNPLFLGISFFQYEVAYWKGGTELDFGMFGLSDVLLTNMSYFSRTYPIYCLEPVASAESGLSLPEAVAATYEGPGVEAALLCAANPWSVPLDFEGYTQIASQGSLPQLERFVERMVHHLGATVTEGGRVQLRSFADRFLGGDRQDFETLASELGSRPSWLDFDVHARCIADRSASPALIGAAIGWACEHLPSVNCSRLPEGCNQESNPYRVGDYVFSRYYNMFGDMSNPLLGCSFGGAAMYASPKLFTARTGASACAEAWTTTTTTTTSTVTTSTATTVAGHDHVRPAFLGGGARVAPLGGLLVVLLAALLGSAL